MRQAMKTCGFYNIDSPCGKPARFYIALQLVKIMDGDPDCLLWLCAEHYDKMMEFYAEFGYSGKISG